MKGIYMKLDLEKALLVNILLNFRLILFLKE